LVGVKTEIDTPYPERPREGKIEFFVDWYEWLYSSFAHYVCHILVDNGPETGCPKIFFHAFLGRVQAVAELCSPQQTQSTFFFMYLSLTIVAV
jgi:hypothetical protein